MKYLSLFSLMVVFVFSCIPASYIPYNPANYDLSNETQEIDVSYVSSFSSSESGELNIRLRKFIFECFILMIQIESACKIFNFCSNEQKLKISVSRLFNLHNK